MPGEFTLDDAVAYINETPALASLLYDADMMPEQCISEISKVRLRLICLHWQRRELEHALDVRDRCAKVISDRMESMRIMADRVGYTREGNDLSQRASELWDTLQAIRALDLGVQDQRAAASGASSTQATPTDISAAAHHTGE